MNNLIILLGQRVRSGTNFVGSTIAQHPDVRTVSLDSSLSEFNLFFNNKITEVFSAVAKSSFGMNFNDQDASLFLKEYGLAWLRVLRQKYDIKDDKLIFIKSPSLNNIELWKQTFPNVKIAIICRDGRDNIISSVRASNDKRDWHSFVDKAKKRFNYFTGRSFINHTKHWKKTAQQSLSIIEDECVRKFKYEELNNSSINIQRLLEFYNLRIDNNILKQCLNAPVVGSSFGISSKGIQKPNWEPDYNKSKFVFSNKWMHWRFIKKSVFKCIAGKELVNLGYEQNNQW